MNRQSNALEMRELCDLKPHPLNRQLYGPLDKTTKEWGELVESIRRKGVLVPLLITPDGTVVSGHRRLEASRDTLNLSRIEVPVVVVNFKSDLDVEEALIHANKQREKTPEQKAREYQHLLRIEKERAKQRMTAGKGADGSGGRGKTKNPTENFSEGLGESAAKAAEQVGWSAPTAKKAAAVVDAIDEAEEEGDAEKAERLRQKLNKTVDGAYREVVPLSQPQRQGLRTDEEQKRWEALAPKRLLSELKMSWDGSGLARKWEKADPTVRQQFIAFIMGEEEEMPKGEPR